MNLKKSETAGRLVEDSSLARVLTADDNNRIVHFTNAGSSVSVSLPADLPEGFSCRLVNETGGSMTLSGSGGLSLLGDSALAQGRVAEVSRIKNTRASVVTL